MADTELAALVKQLNGLRDELVSVRKQASDLRAGSLTAGIGAPHTPRTAAPASSGRGNFLKWLDPESAGLAPGGSLLASAPLPPRALPMLPPGAMPASAGGPGTSTGAAPYGLLPTGAMPAQPVLTAQAAGAMPTALGMRPVGEAVDHPLPLAGAPMPTAMGMAAPEGQSQAKASEDVLRVLKDTRDASLKTVTRATTADEALQVVKSAGPSALKAGGQALLSGGGGAAIGGAAGSALGGAAGTALGGPVGGMVGEAVGGKVGQALGPAIDKVMKPYSRGLDALGTMLGGPEAIAGKIGGGLRQAGQNVATGVDLGTKVVSGDVGGALSAYGDIIKDVPLLGDALKGAGTAMTALQQATTAFVSAANPAAVEKFNIAVRDAQAVIGHKLTPAMDAWTASVRLVGDALATVLPDTADFKAVGAAFTGIIDSLRPAFATILPVIKDLASEGLVRLAGALKGVGVVVTSVIDAARRLGIINPGGQDRLSSARGAAFGQASFTSSQAHAQQTYAAAFSSGTDTAGGPETVIEISETAQRIAGGIAQLTDHVKAILDWLQTARNDPARAVIGEPLDRARDFLQPIRDPINRFLGL